MRLYGDEGEAVVGEEGDIEGRYGTGSELTFTKSPNTVAVDEAISVWFVDIDNRSCSALDSSESRRSSS